MWRPLTPSLGDLMAAGHMGGEWGAAWGPLAEQGPWGVGEAPVLRFGALGLVPLPTGAGGGGAPRRAQACGRGWVPAGLTRGPGPGGRWRRLAGVRPEPGRSPRVVPPCSRLLGADSFRCFCLLCPRLLLLSVCSWGDHLSCEAGPGLLPWLWGTFLA